MTDTTSAYLKLTSICGQLRRLAVAQGEDPNDLELTVPVAVWRECLRSMPDDQQLRLGMPDRSGRNVIHLAGVKVVEHQPDSLGPVRHFRKALDV